MYESDIPQNFLRCVETIYVISGYINGGGIGQLLPRYQRLEISHFLGLIGKPDSVSSNGEGSSYSKSSSFLMDSSSFLFLLLTASNPRQSSMK